MAEKNEIYFSSKQSRRIFLDSTIQIISIGLRDIEIDEDYIPKEDERLGYIFIKEGILIRSLLKEDETITFIPYSRIDQIRIKRKLGE